MIDAVLLLIILASSADTAPRWIVWSLILITTHAIYRLLAIEARRENKKTGTNQSFFCVTSARKSPAR